MGEFLAFTYLKKHTVYVFNNIILVLKAEEMAFVFVCSNQVSIGGQEAIPGNRIPC